MLFHLSLLPRVAARATGRACDVTCWVVIAPDNTVTIRVAHVEMGQGALTGLAMLVAEELECDWATVRTEFVSATENLRRNQVWGDTSTGASRSIASSQDYLRRAGATAREMLIAAAAARWRVPAAQCAAQSSIDQRTRRAGAALTFGAVAEAAAKIEPPANVKLKPPRTWKRSARRRKRLDVLRRKSYGTASLCRSTCGCRTCCTPPLRNARSSAAH